MCDVDTFIRIAVCFVRARVSALVTQQHRPNSFNLTQLSESKELQDRQLSCWIFLFNIILAASINIIA